MKTRITALLLALVMAVCCLTGCTSTRVRSYSEESSDASTDKYAAALDAYKSNKKVMTINGSPVYWNEYAYFLCAIMANMERYGMQITDWSDVYDESTGKYAFNQYGKVMTDLKTEEVEAFRNVIVMYADITTTGIYHIADFNAGGKGYFACGGKLIPITWSCAGDKEPFRFFTESGEPLELGRGNTYMAICTPESPVVCEGMPEQPAETTAAS